MKTLVLLTAAAALLTTAASAAPLSPTDMTVQAGSNVQQARTVCDEFGRCYRTRGPRYVRRGYDDGYYARRDYDGPRYYGRGPGYGYYDDGPSIGFSFGSRGW